jgi:hypothetical protein
MASSGSVEWLCVRAAADPLARRGASAITPPTLVCTPLQLVAVLVELDSYLRPPHAEHLALAKAAQTAAADFDAAAAAAAGPDEAGSAPGGGRRRRAAGGGPDGGARTAEEAALAALMLQPDREGFLARLQNIELGAVEASRLQLVAELRRLPPEARASVVYDARSTSVAVARKASDGAPFPRGERCAARDCSSVTAVFCRHETFRRSGTEAIFDAGGAAAGVWRAWGRGRSCVLGQASSCRGGGRTPACCARTRPTPTPATTR